MQNFPESRDYLREAGLEIDLELARFVRPNVGLSEAEMGLSYADFRALEVRIRASVTAENSGIVARRIKREKYGILCRETMPLDLPSRSERTGYASTSEFRAQRAEFRNTQKTPFSINIEMAHYVLRLTDSVLRESGIDPLLETHKTVRAKSFIVGVYYLLREVPYKSAQKTFGLGISVWKPILSKGVFCLDVPRGICGDKAATFVYMVESLKSEVNVSAAVNLVRQKVASADPMVKTAPNHANVLVRYQTFAKIEGYDPTMGYKLDTVDTDSQISWIARNHRAVNTGSADPFSAMPLSIFEEISWERACRIQDATREFGF